MFLKIRILKYICQQILSWQSFYRQKLINIIMKKLLILLSVSYLFFGVFAETPKTAEIFKLMKPEIVIDSLVDSIWNTPSIAIHNLDRIFRGEEGGITDSTDEFAYWQAVWNDTGMFVFVSATDNVHSNGTFGLDSFRKADRLEFYFNTNVGKTWGPADNKNGRYRFSLVVEDSTKFDSLQLKDLGLPLNWLQIKFKFYRDPTSTDTTNYIFKMFLPWTVIPDSAGHVFVPDGSSQIGFDVYMSDNDGPNDPDGSNFDRTRIVWSNDARFDDSTECAVNMNDAGLLLCKSWAVGVNHKNIATPNIFPNPAKDNIRIQNVSESTLVSIFNMQGKEIFSKNVRNNETINISSFSPGIYFFRVSNNQSNWTGKLIKR